MNTVLIELSLFLLYPFEKASHGIEWLTGHNCFAQARVCARLCAGYCLMVILVSVMKKQMDVAFSHLIFLFYIPGALVEESTHIERKMRDAAMRNPLAVAAGHFLWRLCTLLISINFFCIWLLVSSIGLQFLVILHLLFAINLNACTPLPPGSKGFKDWLKSLSFGTMLPQGAT